MPRPGRARIAFATWRARLWLAALETFVACVLATAPAAFAAGSLQETRLRVDFESSGGYANLQLAGRADTSELDAPTAAQLVELVERSGLLQMSQSDILQRPTPPDAITYRLDIRRDGTQKSFTMNDVTAPEAARPLLEFLRKLALDARRAPRTPPP